MFYLSLLSDYIPRVRVKQVDVLIIVTNKQLCENANKYLVSDITDLKVSSV